MPFNLVVFTCKLGFFGALDPFRSDDILILTVTSSCLGSLEFRVGIEKSLNCYGRRGDGLEKFGIHPSQNKRLMDVD